MVAGEQVETPPTQLPETVEVMGAGEQGETPATQLPESVEVTDTVLAEPHAPLTVVVGPAPETVEKIVVGVQVPWRGLIGDEGEMGVVPGPVVPAVPVVQPAYEYEYPPDEDSSPRACRGFASARILDDHQRRRQ